MYGNVGNQNHIFVYIYEWNTKTLNSKLTKAAFLHALETITIKSKLPKDLLEEILYRVPAISLKRLRSTCKRWNRLFNDKGFSRKHLDKATKQSLILTLKVSRVRSITRTNLHVFSPENFSLTDLHPSLDQTEICQVSHCDGLLLCITNNGLVVWNPCTGQTSFIINRHKEYATYALGSYRDKISNDISYKILSHRSGGYFGDKEEFGIYDKNSNSWRILDVTIDFRIRGNLNWGVSLKGKTYWIPTDEKEEPLLVSFDYTTERFQRLCLPRHYPILSLSVVREEKLSVLLQRDHTSKTEIWVTNKIGEETKVVSWSMVVTVDLGPEFVTCYRVSFWIDEEKKKALVCDDIDDDLYEDKTRVRIVGEDKKVKQVAFVPGSHWPSLFSYVPSLTQF